MFTFLMMVCIFGGIIALGATVAVLMEDPKWTWIPVLILGICIFGAYQIVTTDPERAVNGEGNIVTEYARVNDINERNVKLDGKDWSLTKKDVVTQKYPLNLTGIKQGDIVEFQYISTDFSNYLIKVEKSK